jgi:hypothetical protein
VTEKTFQPKVEIHTLKTYINTEDGVVKAEEGVDFTVGRREVLGLVGESVGRGFWFNGRVDQVIQRIADINPSCLLRWSALHWIVSSTPGCEKCEY